MASSLPNAKSGDRSLSSGYRGRLAPSPTGYLHVGHARTFWTAFQRAREAGGTLIMRMEDLDPDRCRPVYAEAALDDLRWLGIRWQEGPDKGGPFAPYVQSKRRTIYLDVWRRLLRTGRLFPCRCSRKDLATALGAPHERAQTGAAAASSTAWTMSRSTPAPAGCLWAERRSFPVLQPSEFEDAG